MRSSHANRPATARTQRDHGVKSRDQKPNWGNAGKALGKQPSATAWRVRGDKGVLIAKNYSGWSKDWWSPKWGVWFRFDPETDAYYYYEPDLDSYAEVESITAYREPLDTPIAEPTTDPDELPDEVPDVPPDPVEP
jgi:hypothetical protein